MLVDCTRPFSEFMDFLNGKHLIDTPCYLVVHPLYAVVDASPNEDESEFAFAVYAADDGGAVIYCGGDLRELAELLEASEEEAYLAVCESIAHEYVHHLQNVQRREFDEQEAERLGGEWVREFAASR
jgi:hypothetical protein